jgi:hypothetical protein
MPKAVKAKTKATTTKPYEEPRNLEPCDLPRPDSVEEFEALVEKYGPRKKRGRPKKEECEEVCDWCTKFSVELHDATNIFHKTIKVRKLKGRINKWVHSPDRLVKEAQRRWDAPLDLTTFTNDQLSACIEFQNMSHDESATSVMSRLGLDNAGDSVSTQEMQHLATLLMRIFFPDAALELDFQWTSMPSVFGWCLGIPTRNQQCILIALHRTSHAEIPDYPPFNGRARARLGTLLHELVHAYFAMYVCMCEAYKKDVHDAGIHGVAWHHVAAVVERATLPVLGVPLDLGRFRTIQRNWEKMKYWPTTEDFQSWGLQDDY